MSTVYIINEPHKSPRGRLVKASYDVSPAMQFGEIRFIFTVDEFPSPSEDLQAAVDHAWAVLDGFNPEEDYIVWAGGDPISMLIVAPILFDLGGTSVRYLKFERARATDGEKLATGYYVPRTVTIFNEEDDG